MSLLFGGRPLLPLSGFGFAIAAHEVIATKSKNYSNQKTGLRQKQLPQGDTQFRDSSPYVYNPQRQVQMIRLLILLLQLAAIDTESVTQALESAPQTVEGEQGMGYTLDWNCQSCPNQYEGNNCIIIDGGPFVNTTLSIDAFYSSCSATGLIYPIQINFNCHSVCKGCTISISSGYLANSICADSSKGQEFIGLLDDFYETTQLNSRQSYNWCGHAGCPLAPGINYLILILVIGAVAAGIALYFYHQKQKAIQAQQTQDNAYELMER